MSKNTVNRRVNLYINGKEAGNDIKSVKAEMQKLVNEQVRMTRGSDEYLAHAKRIRQLRGIMDEHNQQLKGVKNNWLSIGHLSDSFNRYFGIITAGLASVTGIALGFKKLSEEVAKFDDIYSDVEKTTGLTKAQVKDLNESFKKMDTRTSREELNKLATDAGKLGKNSKQDILDFVDAGNQINVALGEDLGEGAIKNIGKISDVYRTSTNELKNMGLKEQMLSIGSAINELGASSTASEKYLVDFAQRLGGVASQSGISIQNILGYASALDQSGQAVEMSATSLQNFIMKLMEDPAKFARLAGQDVDKFSKLLKTDANEAILTVLQSLNQRGGFQALIPVFSEMGLDGARAVGVLSSLADKISNVKTAQEISNRGFAEATSITDEYGKKNNNLQAELEKSRKAFKEQALTLGEKLGPALVISTNGMTYLIKALTKAPEFMKENRTLLIALAGALTTYAAISAEASIKTNLMSAKTSILSGIKKAYNVVIGESVMQKEREIIGNQVYVEELEKAISKEQIAVLQKQGLSKTSKEYVDQLQSAAQRNLASTEANVTALRKEITTLSASVESKKNAYAAASNLVEQRRYEVYWAQQSGNSIKIATAEKRLEEAMDKKGAASKIYMSTTREFHSKKIQLETAAQKANTLSTQINTATDTANAAAKQALFSVTTKLTTAMKALWISMKTNPLGWIAAAVSAVVMFNSKTEKAGETISRFNVVSKEAFDKTSKAINSNSMVIDQLIDRYKILKSVTNPTNEQQSELRDVIKKIAELVPAATSAVDQYNQVLDISTDKAIGYSKKQKEILSELSGKNATEWIDELYAGSKKMYIAQEELSKGLKFSNFWGWSNDDKLSPSEEMVTEKELDNLKVRRDILLQLLSDTGIAEKELRAEFTNMFSMTEGLFSRYEGAERDNAIKYFDQYFSKQNYLLDQKNNQDKNNGKDNTAVLKEISLLTDKQKLQEYLLSQDAEIKNAAQARLNALNRTVGVEADLIKAKEKELELVRQTPARTEEEIIARNKKIAIIQEELNKLNSLGVRNNEIWKTQEELASRKLKAEQDVFQKVTEIRNELGMKGLSDAEKEIQTVKNKYDALLALCKQYNLDSTELLRHRTEELYDIYIDEYEKEIDAEAEYDEKLRQFKLKGREKEKADIRSQYAALIYEGQLYGRNVSALIAERDGKLKEVDERGSFLQKIFGLSDEDSQKLEEKISMALDMAGQLSDIWGQFNQIQANRDQKELQDYEKDCNKKKELLNKQLNSGRISQEKYNAQVAQLDADLDKKKTEIARKQAKREKAQSIFSTIINTASAVVQALLAKPPASYIFAALSAAMGAAQLGVIMSQPLPEFAEGGKTDGAKLYVAGEAGQEWISPNWMLKNPVTGPIIERLELVRSGILSPKELAPAVPDWQTMTSVPLYAGGGYSPGNTMQTNYYTSETPSPEYPSVLDDINGNIRNLCEYLSDERNRRAVISNDLLSQNAEEMSVVNRLRRL